MAKCGRTGLGCGSTPLLAAALLVLFSAAGWTEYDPPAGAGAYYDLASPSSLMDGSSMFSSPTPSADALNPASSGANQRPVLDLSYLGLPGFGAEAGFGSAANVGLSIPTPSGVFSGSARLVAAPAGFSSLDLGVVGGLNFSFAKKLYPRLLVGAGLGFLLGKSGADPVDWGLDADIGVVHQPGDLGVLKDFVWGVALRDMGKGYSPDPAMTSFPPPFSLAAGLAFDLVQSPWLTWGFVLDLSFPSFQDVRVDAATRVEVRDVFYLTLAGHFGLHEVFGTFGAAPSPRSLPLTFGVGFRIRTNAGKDITFLKATERGWNRSQIDVDVGAAPLQSGIWGIGLGVNVSLGEIDRTGPALALTAPETTYVSPAVPGTQDVLQLPAGINDTRYVKEYDLTIADSQGSPVRTIGETEGPPATIWKRLTFVEKQMSLPSSFAWDGKTDAGDMVPDGTYTFRLRAVDDNGNSSETAPGTVVVDNTLPVVTVATEYLVFSPNGDGSKDSLPIAQTGSSEDLWVGRITDASGAAVREWQWQEAEPADIAWDGLTGDGVLAPDGLYAYQVSSTDRAGNAGAALVTGIEINTRPTPVSLSIDKAFFSPNDDGVKDTVSIFADVPVSAGIVSWTLLVKNQGGTAVRTYRGGQTGPESVVFDGKDDKSGRLPEGSYTAALSLVYLNGNTPAAASSAFAIDLTKPSVTVKADFAVFSPNGDGKRDEVTIIQESSEEVQWTGEIADSSGSVVSSVTWRGRVDPKLVWNGRGPEGQLLPDGRYSYVVSATDRAGNFGTSERVSVDLNTEDTQVFLSTDLAYFSPNADKVKDRIRILPQLRVTEGIRSYELRILDPADAVVRTYTGRASAPEPYSWDGLTDDGKRAPDGAYRADFHISYVKGDEHTVRVGPFYLDTKAPEVSLAVADLLFSPDGDGRKDTVTVRQSSSDEDLWEAEIRDGEGTIVRSLFWKGTVADFVWNGRDDVGNKVADGLYAYRVGATDKAGNTVLKEIADLQIDTRLTPVYVSAQAPAISPNGDGIKDEQTLKLILGLKEGIKAWRLEVRHSSAGVQKSFTSETAIPAQIVWDGRRENGTVAPEGGYEAVLTVEYLKGNLPTATTTPFVLDVTPPKLTQSVSPAPFSPDEDGVNDLLTISTTVTDISPIDRWSMRIIDPQGTVFATYAGTGIPTTRLTWGGLSPEGKRATGGTIYRLQAALEDTAGNATSAQLTIPVEMQLPFVQLTPPSGKLLISPDGDGNRDTVTIRQQSSPERSWTGEVRDAGGRVVRSYGWSGKLADVVWDGKDSAGLVVPDGLYTYVVRAPRRADVTAEARVAAIQVDNRRTLLLVTVSRGRFSPNGDGKVDSVDIGIFPSIRDGVTAWKLDLVHDTAGVQMSFTGTAAPPETQRWDGKTAAGRTAPDGTYRAVMSMEYEKGNRPNERSSSFVLDVTPPAATLTLTPRLFSPDEDGTDDVLAIGMKVSDAGSIVGWSLKILDPTEQLFIDFSGAAVPPERITWDGLSRQRELVQAATDYPIVLNVEDDVGNVAVVRDLIPIDVLVIREGDRLKIRISSITFPPNVADLSKVVEADKRERNEKTLKRIAEILNKFSSYKIRIEGHANSVYWYDAARAKKEQDEELAPLSTARAEAVKAVLVTYGVREDRITTAGLGGAEPIVVFSDVPNTWKNRRVEFVLTQRQ